MARLTMATIAKDKHDLDAESKISVNFFQKRAASFNASKVQIDPTEDSAEYGGSSSSISVDIFDEISITVISFDNFLILFFLCFLI